MLNSGTEQPLLVWLGEAKNKNRHERQADQSVHRNSLQTQEQLLKSCQVPNEKIGCLAAKSLGHSKEGDHQKMKF